MILTPISLPDLPHRLSQFDRCLDDHPWAQAVFRRIAGTTQFIEGDQLSLSQDTGHHAQAVELCRRFGMEIIWEAPSAAYTWDGRAVRVLCEPSVLIHEVAHLQCCTPDRRAVLDFGLGAGPETGQRAEADHASTVFGVDRDLEEAQASLLGILWEAELRQPAILAFLEQNWLEGGDSPANKAHFLKILGHLRQMGLVDDEGRPTTALRETAMTV